MNTRGELRNNNSRNVRVNAYLEILKLRFEIVVPKKSHCFRILIIGGNSSGVPALGFYP